MIINFTGDIYITVNGQNQVLENCQPPKQQDKAEEPETRLNHVVNGKRQPWRSKKRKSIRVAKAMHSLGLNKAANRVYWCSTKLVRNEAGRVIATESCKDRMCPMCSWRKSIKTFYELSQVMDVAQAEQPTYEPIFLTLTVRNCTADELPVLLDTVFKGWYLLTKHRRFNSNIKGWFRALEITYNDATDTYHPHFHVILMVDKSYFGMYGGYISTQDWVHIWRVSCKLDYEPVCDVRAVKATDKRRRVHLAEVSKYTVKDNNYVFNSIGQTAKVVDVLREAMRHRRLFAYGGFLKVIRKQLGLKDPEESEFSDMILETAKIREDVAEVLTVYKWDFGLSDYIRQS